MTGWQKYLNQAVVVDTDSSFVYLGTLVEVNDRFVVLRDVDAHDSRETPTTKEKYVMEAKRFGIRANRKEVAVRIDKVVSLALLADIMEY